MSPEGHKPSEQIDIKPLLLLGGIFLLSTFALSKKQRRAILDRDDNTSQMRHYSEDNGWRKGKKCGTSECPLQVHHIETQRNGGGDVPENLLTILECEHNGRCITGNLLDPSQEFIVHPDMPQVFTDYRRGNKNAFADMQTKRNEKIEKGEQYWNSDHDREMLETAEENTKKAGVFGWLFPRK